MRINVKYFGRDAEGRKAPSWWLNKVFDDAMEYAADAAEAYANEASNPNDMGDDWQAAYNKAYDEEYKEALARVENMQKKIYFQEEGICSCCEQQCGASYPWEDTFHSAHYDMVGECEGCYVGLCECIEDHA